MLSIVRWQNTKINFFVGFVLAMGILVFLQPYSLSADPLVPVVVGEDAHEYDLGRRLSYLEDPGGGLSLEEIVSAPTDNFEALPDKVPNFGFTSSAYWFRVSLQNSFKVSKQFFLKIGYPLLDRVDLYIPDAEGGYKVRRAGDHLPFAQREFEYPDFVFGLQLEPGARQTYYLRVQTSSAVNVPLSLMTPAALAEHLTTENMVLGIFFGILFAMMAHNCFVFFSTRDAAYFFYILFVFCNILFQFTLRGLTFEYLWPNQVWWANNCLPAIIFACYLTAAQFTRFAVNSKDTTPRLDALLQWVSGVVLLGLLVSFFLEYSLSIKIATAFILTVPLFIYMAIKSLLRGYRPAIYYCIAWGVSLGGYFVFALKSFGFLPYTFFTHYGIQIGSAWEVILFSIGLADRYHFLKKEKELLQVQYAEKLQATNRQLENTNVDLDRANIDLQSTVALLSEEVATRKRIQLTLTQSEKTARALIDTPFNHAALIAPDGTILDVNKTLADSLGVPPQEIIGSKCYEPIAGNGLFKDRYSYLVRTVETGEILRFEDRWHEQFFDTILSPVLDEHGEVLRVCLISRDISERIESEKSRQEMEVKAISQAKLASLGQIATGIAHEINQPLSYIKIIFESALRDIEQGAFDLEEMREDAAESLRQVERITTIISHLRTFGRAEDQEFDSTHIPTVFNNAMILMRERLHLANIESRVSFADDLPPVLGNSVKLEQIFINLLQNSLDAMRPMEEIKRIWVRGRASEGHVHLEFEDNGPGVGGLEESIFEPFFTTKPPGEGTGLGLAIIYTIIQEHHGTISCHPGSTGGALFTITLPTYEVPVYVA